MSGGATFQTIANELKPCRRECLEHRTVKMLGGSCTAASQGERFALRCRGPTFGTLPAPAVTAT